MSGTNYDAMTADQLAALIGAQPPPSLNPASAQTPASSPFAPPAPNPFDAYHPDDLVQMIAATHAAHPDAVLSVAQPARAAANSIPVVGPWLNKADAATNALIAPVVQPLLGKIPGYDHAQDLSGDFGSRYQQSLQMQNALDHAYDQAHPVASKAAKLAGLVAGAVEGSNLLAPISKALPASAGIIPRVLAGATEGAVGGGIHSAGTVDDPNAMLGAGSRGALLGGVVGGAAPVVMSAGKHIWDATAGKWIDSAMAPVSVSNGAANNSQLADILSKASPGSSGAGIDQMAAQSASPALSVKPSQFDAAIGKVSHELGRAGIAPEDAVSQVQGLGPYGALADTTPGTRDLLRSATNTPGNAGGIASQALDLRQNGLWQDGEAVVRPSSGRVVDAAAKGMGVQGQSYYDDLPALTAAQKAAAGPAYAKAYAAPPVPLSGPSNIRGDVENAFATVTGQGAPSASSGPLAQFESSPLFQQAYDKARAISQGEFVNLPDGTEQIMPLPAKPSSSLDWRTLDLMKQGLDDMKSTGLLQGIGANQQGMLKGFTGRFVDTLDKLNPDYASARAAFAGPAAVKDAMNSGLNFLKGDAEVAGQSIESMTPSEQNAFRVGSLQALKTKLGNMPVTYDAAAKAGVLTPNQLERFQAVFPDKKAFSDFVGNLNNESRMFATRAAVTGNSTTAKQMARLADSNGITPADAIAAVHTHGASLVSKLFHSGNAMDEGTANALATILTNPNTTDQAAYAAAMGAAKKRAATAAILNGSGQNIGVYGTQQALGAH